MCVRIDDGVADGGEISMFYDPMIAKLITWAPSREAAIDAQIAALDSFVIDGISDNVDFLSALMQHPRFRQRRPRDRFHRRRISRRLSRRPGGRASWSQDLAVLAGMVGAITDARAAEIDGQLGDTIALPSERVGPDRGRGASRADQAL